MSATVQSCPQTLPGLLGRRTVCGCHLTAMESTTEKAVVMGCLVRKGASSEDYEIGCLSFSTAQRASVGYSTFMSQDVLT